MPHLKDHEAITIVQDIEKLIYTSLACLSGKVSQADEREEKRKIAADNLLSTLKTLGEAIAQ